ncbi:MAG TPA: hypothetical protein VFT21_13970 [Gemmatimonadaceae bacterium]|nr:hypothetical protein [Gemmatimonadaceae bacterium]
MSQVELSKPEKLTADTRAINARQEIPAGNVQLEHQVNHELRVDEGFSLARLGVLLLRHWRFLVALPLVVVPLVVASTALRSRTYTARVSFLPQSNSTAPAGLRGLAAQFGIEAFPDAGRSPDFYVDLLSTNEILGQVVSHEYEVHRDGKVIKGDLITLQRTAGTTPAVRRDRAIARLRRDMSVSTARRSSIVTLSVRESYPELASAIAQRMLEAIGQFDQHTRQSQAASERLFLERRLELANSELRDAEQALQVFNQRNRTFRDSPALEFEHDRLQRKVDERQTVVTSLVQAYEQSRVNEVRDTPVLTVIQQAQTPSSGDPRHLIPRTLLAGILTLGVAFLLVVMRDALRHAHDEDPRLAQEFDRVRGDFLRLTRIGKRTAR